MAYPPAPSDPPGEPQGTQPEPSHYYLNQGSSFPPSGQFPQYTSAPPTPPPRPTRRRSIVVFIAVPALVLVTALAVTIGYLLGGDSGEPSLATSISPAPEESSSAPESPSPTPSPEWDPDEFEIPTGFLGVASLGALTRQPDGFEEYEGPGAATVLSVDAHTYHYQDSDNWHSLFSVGVLNASGVLVDTEDLEGTAEATIEKFAESSAFASVAPVTIDWVGTELLPIDGKTGVLSSALFEWEPTDYTEDTFEAVAVLIVEIDRTTAWIGFISITGTHFDELYEPASFALINTTFEI